VKAVIWCVLKTIEGTARPLHRLGTGKKGIDAILVRVPRGGKKREPLAFARDVS